MRLDWLVAPERAFHHEQVNAFGKPGQRLRVTRVRSVDKRCSARIRQAQRKALARVRCRKSLSLKTGQDFKLVGGRDLADFDGERLLQEVVIVCFIERTEEFLQSRSAEDRERLAATLCLRGMFCAEEKGGEAADVIQMEMADPDGVQINPIKILLSHAMNAGRAGVEQERSAIARKPVRARRTLRVRNGCA